MTENRDGDANRLAAEAYARGEPAGWFEPLYAQAAEGRATVPWDRGTPSPQVVDWLAGRDGHGLRAVVVGSGLGRDSEHLATLGYVVTGFDLSASAVRGARERHPHSSVTYEVADLLSLPGHFVAAFDLVIESYTVQPLPEPPRAAAIAAVSSLLAAGGTLFVVAVARADDEPEHGPPFPLTRREIESFADVRHDIHAVDIRLDVDAAGGRRWLAEFVRSAQP